MQENERIILQTERWIKSVVIDLNFCPFANKVMLKKQIHYAVQYDADLKKSLEIVTYELDYLETNTEFETTFVLFPNSFLDFSAYLILVKRAERLLSKLGYDGIYQIASFHPDYCFADAEMDDVANFTNRSVYPMLHLLREESITKALKTFKNPENIPQQNIDLARQKGLHYMQMLRAACLDS
jgi:hypothetical protein